MQKLLIVQPALMHYRQPVYNRVNDFFAVTVVCGRNSVDPEHSQFETVVLPVVRFKRFYWQKGVIDVATRLKPAAVWIAADVNCLSSIALTLWCHAKKIPIFLHGQGVVKGSPLSWARIAILKWWIHKGTKYVSYAPVCTESLLSTGFPPSKICTIANRLECAPRGRPRPPTEEARGVLFVGRLRPSCELETLIEAVRKINEARQPPVELHIVGGSQRMTIESEAKQSPWLSWHGTITETWKLEEIARRCAIGVYPGAAGLSVLTYMQLGLAPIVGHDLSRHMGPEPSWVQSGKNGWTFDFGELEALRETLLKALEDPNLHEIRSRALETFNALHETSYGQEMARLIASECKA